MSVPSVIKLIYTNTNSRSLLTRQTKLFTYQKSILSTAEKVLHSCNVTLRTAKNEFVDLNAVYYDNNPRGFKHGSAILVHGAPGSHNDFKYVIPLLWNEDIRVIGINFPGFGYTSYDDRLLNDTNERVQLIEQILDKLNVNSDMVFLGHSRGCPDVLKTAINCKSGIRGIVLANSVGFHPSTGLPFPIMRHLAWLWAYKNLRFVVEPIAQKTCERSGFRTTGQIAGLCMQVSINTPFDDLRNFVQEANDRDLRVVTAFAGKDPIVEPTTAHEFNRALGIDNELICAKKDDKDVIGAMQTALSKGDRCLGVFFKNDGHYLQKTRAKFLAEAVISLLS